MDAQRAFFAHAPSEILTGDPLENLLKGASLTVVFQLLQRGQLSFDHRFDNGDTLLQALIQKSDKFYSDQPPGFEGTRVPAAGGAWTWPTEEARYPEFLATFLVQQGQSPFSADSSQRDLLDICVRQSWNTLFSTLLEHPQRPSVKHLENRLFSTAHGSATARSLPLPHYFARNGNTTALRHWLNLEGTDVDLRDKHGRTPLFFAHDTLTAQLLYDQGADLFAQSNDQRTVPEFWNQPDRGSRLGGSNGISTTDLHAWRTAHIETSSESDIPVRFTHLASATPTLIEIKLDDAAKEDWAKARHRSSLFDAPRDWGVVGFIGGSWLKSRPSSTTMCAVSQWLRQLPTETMLHESLPGIPDARILLEALTVTAGTLRNAYVYNEYIEWVQAMKKLGLSAQGDTHVLQLATLAGAAIDDLNPHEKKALVGLWVRRLTFQPDFPSTSEGNFFTSFDPAVFSTVSPITCSKAFLACGHRTALKKAWAYQANATIRQDVYSNPIVNQPTTSRTLLALAATQLTEPERTGLSGDHSGWKAQAYPRWIDVLDAWQDAGLAVRSLQQNKAQWNVLAEKQPATYHRIRERQLEQTLAHAQPESAESTVSAANVSRARPRL